MADTWTVGGATSGYCATGSCDRATMPTMTMTIDSTEAKIGRSMKKCEIMGVCASASLDKVLGCAGVLSFPNSVWERSSRNSVSGSLHAKQSFADRRSQTDNILQRRS